MLKLKIGKKKNKVTVYTRDEYHEWFNPDIRDCLDDLYPELRGMKYSMCPENSENPYEAIIYENGEVWIYGANFDTSINTQADTVSNAIVALKMLVAGEGRELNQYDAEKFNADLDFSEVK